MGLIRIEIGGTFGYRDPFTSSAEAGGHANALQRAIEYLVDLLPEAIENDHRLHEQGELPASYFGTVRNVELGGPLRPTRKDVEDRWREQIERISRELLELFTYPPETQR